MGYTYYDEDKKKKKKSQDQGSSSRFQMDSESPKENKGFFDVMKKNNGYIQNNNGTHTAINRNTTNNVGFFDAMKKNSNFKNNSNAYDEAIELNRKHYDSLHKNDNQNTNNADYSKIAELNRKHYEDRKNALGTKDEIDVDQVLADNNVKRKDSNVSPKVQGIFDEAFAANDYRTEELKKAEENLNNVSPFDTDKAAYNKAMYDYERAKTNLDLSKNKEKYDAALESKAAELGLTEEEVEQLRRDTEQYNYGGEKLMHSLLGVGVNKLIPAPGVANSIARQANLNYDKQMLEDFDEDALKESIGNRGYQLLVERNRKNEDFAERNQIEKDKALDASANYLSINDNSSGITDALDDTFYASMEEQQNYNYLYNTTYDKAYEEAINSGASEEEAKTMANSKANEEANKYLDTLGLDAKRTAMFAGFSKEYAEEHPILATASSIAFKPLEAIGQIDNALKYIGGNPNDENSLANLPAQMNTTMRGTVRSNIDNPLLKFGYDVGTSMGDMVLSNRLGFGNNNLSLILMGGEAANETYTQLLNEGYTATDAMVMSTVAGGAEIITEKIPMEEIFSADKKGIRQILKSALFEGVEEVESDVINDIADILYSQLSDRGQIKSEIEAYMAKGMSEEDAQYAVFNDHLKQAAYDFGAGAGSGGLANAYHGAVTTAVGMKNTNQLSEEAQKTIANIAVNSKDSKLAKLAEKVVNGTANAYEKYKTVRDTIDENNIGQQIENKLIDEGVSKKEVEEAKAAIVKTIAQVDLTEDEYDIAQTEPVRKVLSDITKGDLDAAYERQLAVNDALKLTKNNVNTTQTQNVTPSVENTENEAENNVESADESKKIVALSNYARNAQQRLGTMPIESLNDIQDVVNDEEGNIQIVTNDGNKVNNPYVKNRALGVVISNATTLFNDGASAKAYIQNFDPAMNLKAYNTITTEMIKAGKADAGTDKSTLISTVKSLQNMGGDVGYYAKKLPASFFNDMYAYGVKEENQRSEVVASDPQRNVVNAIASQFSNSGLNITIEDNNTEYNGKLVGTNNLVLSSHADKALMSVLSHELTHYFKKKTNLYNDYEKAVIDFLKESGQYEELVKAKKKQGYADNEIDEEIVADAAENFLSDKKVIDRVCKNDKNLANKIISWLNQTIKDLKKLFGSADPRTAEGRIMKNLEKQNLAKYEEIRDLWVNAYEAAAKSENVAETLQNSTKVSNKSNLYVFDDIPEIKNYQNKEFNNYIDNVLNNGETKSYTLNAKLSSELANEISNIVNEDVSDFSNEINGNAIRHIKRRHDGSGKSADGSMKDNHNIEILPYVLENFDPKTDKVLDLNKVSNEFKNSNGTPSKEVIIQKKLNNRFYYVTEAVPISNKKKLHVVSAYINSSDLSQKNNTRQVAMAKAPSSDVQNEPISVTNSITNNSENVNNSDEKKSLKLDSLGRTLTVGQQNFYKNVSDEIKDNKGNLKVYYHGTETPGFTVFNPSNRKGFTDNYNAIYVTDSLDVAKTYTINENKKGDSVYPLYVKAENPYVVDVKGQSFHNWSVDNYAKHYIDVKLEGVGDADRRFAYWHESDDGGRKLHYGEFSLDELVKKFGEKIGIFDFDYDTWLGNIYLDENGNNIPTSTDDCVLHAKNNGYDSVVFNNIRDMGRFAYDSEESQVVALLNPNQVKSIYNENPTNKKDIRFSMKQPIEDSKGRKLSDNQQKFYANCEVRDAAGNLQVLYHQTDSDFTKFDTRRAGAGQHDFLTPYGVFLKPTSNDIGLKGKKQMELYANITNMLNVNSRYELENYLKKDADLKEAIDSMKAIDTEYQAKFDEAKKAWTKYIVENSKPGKSLRNDPELERLMDEESEIVEEWGNEYDKRAEKVKAKVDAYLRSQGYDGVHILNDDGSFGRKVETYIAFEPNQVKDVNNLNPTENVDIKHSLKADKAEIEKVWQQVKEIVPAEIRDEVYKHDTGKGDYSAHQAYINGIYYDKNNLKKATRYCDGFAIAYLIEKDDYQIPHKPDGKVDYLQIDRDVRGVTNYDRKYGKWLKNLFSDAITENKLTLEDYLKERETTSSDYDVLKIRKLHQDEVVKYAEAYINDELSKDERLKFEQFRLVDKANPPFNDTSYWIRSPKDIMTFEEAINDDSALGMLPIEEGTTYEDLTADMLKKAKESGIITVYHGGGKGIKNGDFVTPSKMMASEYAGDPSEVYAKTVNLSDVAWLDAEQGMYANRKGAKYSKKSLDDQVKDFREVDRYMPVAESILPLADFLDDYNAIDEGFNIDNAGDIAADIAKGNTTYIDIAKEMYENPYEYAVDDKEAEQIQKIAANAIGAYEEIKRAKIEALEKDAGVKYSKKYTDADDDIFFNEDTWENSEAQNSAKNTADILKEGFEELKKLKESGKAHFTHADALRLAEKYQREYGTSTGKEYIANNIESIFAYIENNRDNVRYDDMLRVMRDAAMPIVEKQSNALDEYDDFRKYVKDLNIRLNDQQRAEVINTYGSMKTFRKAIGSRINVTDNGQNIDSLWQDICEASGYYLDPDENSNTQILALADALDSMRDIGDNSGMSTSDKAYDLALNIYTDYFKLNGVENITKQMKKQIEDYKAASEKAYKEIINKQKEESKLQLDKLRNELKRLEAEKEIASQDKIERADIDKELDRYRQRILKLKDEILVGKAWRRSARLKAAESRQKTILRNRIKSIVNDLSKRLTNPTEGHHVPEGLVNATIDVLQNIDLNTGKSVNMAEKLRKLSEKYEAIKKGYGEEVNPDYDPNLQKMIDQLGKMFEGRSIAKLSQNELEEVFTICKALQTQIRNMSKFIDSQIKEDIYKTGKNIIEDVNANKGVGEGKLANMANSYLTASVNAERFFNRLSGYKDDSALNKLYDDLNEGSHKMMQIEFDVSDIMKNVLEGDENQKLADKFKGDNKKDWIETPWKDKNGNTIKVPQSFRASLFMHMMNDQNMKHIMYGGFTLPNEKLYQAGKIKDAYTRGTTVKLVDTTEMREILKQINETESVDERNELWKKYNEAKDKAEKAGKATLKNFLTDMTPYERDWCRYAARYFHDYSGKKINETSLKLNGYAKAVVDNYFPIKTDPSFTRSDMEGVKLDATIEGWGNLKERVNGSNPIVIEGIDRVLNAHSKMLAKYVGMAIPIRNFNKVYGVTLGGYIDSVKKAIGSKFGERSNKFINDLFTDLQTSRTRDDALSKVMNTIRSNYAQAVLTTNLSVAWKQAASYPTAAAELGWDAIGKTMLSKAGLTDAAELALPMWLKKNTKEIMETAEKYTPLLKYRNLGNSTQELGDLKRQRTWLQKHKISNNIVTGLTNWIQNIDTTTVASLWKASEYRVAKDNANLQPGTDEFYKEVAKVFNKAVERTQPNYTVLQRPDILRSPNEFLKQVFMFKTQPLQNLGIMIDATGNLKAKVNAYKADPSAENKAKVDKARKQFRRALTSQVAAAATFSAMTLAVNALLHNLNGYRDDDKELTLEAILKKYFKDVGGAMAGSLPLGTELYDRISSWVTGDKWYDLSVSSIDTINNIIKDIDKIYNADSTTKTIESTKKLIKDTSMLYGIPLGNIEKIYNGGKYHIEDIKNNEFGSFEAGVERSTKVQSHRMYEALQDDDMDKFNEIYDEVGADKAMNGTSSVTSLIKADYMKDDISYDDALEYLQEIGFGKKDASDKIYGWNKDYVEKAYKEGKMDADEAKEYLENHNVSEEEADEIIKKCESDLIQEDYMNDDIDYNEALSQLQDAGYSKEESITQIQKWETEYIKKEYENEKVTEEEVADYLEPVGISRNDSHFLVQQWETGSSSDYASVYEAIDNYDTKAIVAAVREMKSYGYDNERLLKASISNKYKQKYIELYNTNKTEAAKLKSAILTYYQACGKDREKASKQVDNWLKEK